MIGSHTWAKDRGTRFYRNSAVLAVLVALVGFFLTYIKPMALGRFNGPSEAHVHGFLLASWLVLVVVQAQLFPSHRKLGWLALALAPAIAFSTFAIGLAVAKRDMALQVPNATASVAGNTTASLIFLLVVAAAIWQRRDPQWHKRLIFIATVTILWPAWFRWRHFLPWIPRPDFVLGLVVADLPLVIAMLRDRFRFGAIHPAYLWVGLPLIVEQTFESVLFATGQPLWSAFGTVIYDLAR